MSLRLLLLTVLSFVLCFVSFGSGRQSYALKITFNIALCTFLPCYVLGFKIKRWFWINCLLLSFIIGLIFPHLIFQWKVLPVYHVTLIRYNSSRDANLQILTVISFCDNLIIIGIACMSCGTKGVLIWKKLAPGWVSHRDDFLILYRVYMFACFFIVPWPTWWRHPKLPNYVCTTRSSLPADQFHTETSGRFAFTWYRCKILHLSEILSMVLHLGWSHDGVTWHFVVVSCKQIPSHEREPEWTQPGAKVARVSCKHPLSF